MPDGYTQALAIELVLVIEQGEWATFHLAPMRLARR